MPSPFAISIDELLLHGLKRRDGTAQTQVYALFRRAVYTLALRVLGDSQAALDALQDSFISAYTHAKDCREAARFGFWLRSIVLRRCLQELRTQPQTCEFAELAAELEPALQPENALGLQRSIDLERALGQLKPRARTVLWLYYVEGYQHHEIAELFGLSSSFSKSQLARASECVRQFLEPDLCPTNT